MATISVRTGADTCSATVFPDFSAGIWDSKGLGEQHVFSIALNHNHDRIRIVLVVRVVPNPVRTAGAPKYVARTDAPEWINFHDIKFSKYWYGGLGHLAASAARNKLVEVTVSNDGLFTLKTGDWINAAIDYKWIGSLTQDTPKYANCPSDFNGVFISQTFLQQGEDECSLHREAVENAKNVYRHTRKGYVQRTVDPAAPPPQIETDHTLDSLRYAIEETIKKLEEAKLVGLGIAKQDKTEDIDRGFLSTGRVVIVDFFGLSANSPYQRMLKSLKEFETTLNGMKSTFFRSVRGVIQVTDAITDTAAAGSEAISGAIGGAAEAVIGGALAVAFDTTMTALRVPGGIAVAGAASAANLAQAAQTGTETALKPFMGLLSEAPGASLVAGKAAYNATLKAVSVPRGVAGAVAGAVADAAPVAADVAARAAVKATRLALMPISRLLGGFNPRALYAGESDSDSASDSDSGSGSGSGPEHDSPVSYARRSR
jgi:hypothetical protein